MAKHFYSLFIYSLLLLSLACHGASKQLLRVLSWEGYVTQQELQEINQLLEKQGYDYEVQLIEPYADGAIS